MVNHLTCLFSDNGGLGGAGNLGNNVAQEDNWIPIELDRAAEELTWERVRKKEKII